MSVRLCECAVEGQMPKPKRRTTLYIMLTVIDSRPLKYYESRNSRETTTEGEKERGPEPVPDAAESGRGSSAAAALAAAFRASWSARFCASLSSNVSSTEAMKRFKAMCADAK